MQLLFNIGDNLVYGFRANGTWAKAFATDGDDAEIRCKIFVSIMDNEYRKIAMRRLMHR